MNLSIKIFVASLLLVFATASSAQTNQDIPPKSFLISGRLFSAPAEHVFSFDVDPSILDRREDRAGHMPGFAYSIPADISLINTGTWSIIPGGGRVWRVRLSSPGALALIPCFDQFYLPDGATLHVYNPARDEVIGAFTAANKPADGKYSTGLIHGDACIIEYYEPASAIGQGRLHLNEIGHAYRMVPGRKSTEDFGDSEPCEVNVKCGEGNIWQDQKNAVVRILVKTGSSFGWCSGALVNNTSQDCTPYVLSADHCYQDDLTGALPSTGDLSLWMFYFRYESPTCANPASEGTLGNNFITGCTFKAASLDTGGNRGSDFALLRLNSSPPLSYTPYYAGWSNANVASANGVGIHHPNADIKKISTYLTPLQSVSWGGVVFDTHWQILWAATADGHGVTEGGSSGSPIFDFNHHIVGTLTGGLSDCNMLNQNDFYGKFSFHWASNGATSNKRLQDWLDPGSTGVQTLDGLYAPCTAGGALNAAITAIQQQGPLCDSSIAITCTLTNYGNNQLNSDSLAFVIDGATQQMLWTGALGFAQSTQVSLPAQTFTPGQHTVTVTSSSPNGGTDGDPANDSRSSVFSVAPPAGQYSFFLQTGDQGSQISWELTDLSNNVLYSGGPYTDNASGQVINQSWCLPTECYTFTIFSAAGDGIHGNTLAGTYHINDHNGNVVAQVQQVNFGASESVSVCQGAHLGISNVDAVLASIDIYPNPSTGLYTIRNAQDATSFTVTDALGRIVRSMAMKNQAVRQVDLSGEDAGVYFFKFTSAQGSTVKKVVLSTRD